MDLLNWDKVDLEKMGIFSSRYLRIEFYVDGKKTAFMDIPCGDGHTLKDYVTEIGFPSSKEMELSHEIEKALLLPEVPGWPDTNLIEVFLCCSDVCYIKRWNPYIALWGWTKKNIPPVAKEAFLGKKLKLSVKDFPESLEMMIV
jgi:hypothetical protein